MGIGGLRDAVTAARDADDAQLEAAALAALGAALVHAAKGRDEEGSAVLHRAIAAAEAAGDDRLAASAHRELGYVAYLRGDYPRGAVLLRRAEELAAGDALECSKVEGVFAIGHTDMGRPLRGEEGFRISIDLAASIEDRRQLAWAMGCFGRSQLLSGRLEEADETLSTAAELCRDERMTAFLPFPEALLAEVWVQQGRCDRAADAFEHAFTLGCTVDDACWEAYGVRGLALLKAADDDLSGSLTLLEDALTRAARQRDTHLWLRAHVIDAACAVALAAKDRRAAAWIDALEDIAERTGMRELAVRAYIHRSDLGDPSALEAAHALAADTDNPRLVELLDRGGRSPLGDLLGHD
jgi:tetratricopeptide (TPR) repeat protein